MPKALKRTGSRKCSHCGKEVVETGQREGMPIVKHVSKKDEKRCIRLWLAERRAEATERMFSKLR